MDYIFYNKSIWLFFYIINLWTEGVAVTIPAFPFVLTSCDASITVTISCYDENLSRSLVGSDGL